MRRKYPRRADDVEPAAHVYDAIRDRDGSDPAVRAPEIAAHVLGVRRWRRHDQRNGQRDDGKTPRTRNREWDAHEALGPARCARRGPVEAARGGGRVTREKR